MSKMVLSKEKRSPGWKPVLIIGCCLYALSVWVLPIILLPIVKVLPLLQEKSLIERLPVYSVGTAGFVLALHLIGRGGPPEKQGPLWSLFRGDPKLLLGVLIGLAVFTVSGAALSANCLGLLAKGLPGMPYQSAFRIEEVDFSGTRNKSVSLALRDPEDGKPFYLVLSRRLFEYPEFKPGDVLILEGKKGALGVYVTDFKLAESSKSGVRNK